MRLSDCDEEKLFSDISKCDCLFSETDVEYSPISLSREEIGEVYRSITAPKSKEFIINRFLKTTLKILGEKDLSKKELMHMKLMQQY